MKTVHIIIGLQWVLILMLGYVLIQDWHWSKEQASYGFLQGWQRRGRTYQEKLFDDIPAPSGSMRREYPEGIDVTFDNQVFEGATQIYLAGPCKEELEQ